MTIRLGPRDWQILEALTRKVRLLSFHQIASTWWPPGKSGSRNAARRLRQLLLAGFLVRDRVLARPLPPLPTPVAYWSPGQRGPCFGSVSWILATRWTFPPRPTTVYLASRRAAGLFGERSSATLKRPYQATHDLGVSEVYLLYLRRDPPSAERWIGEDHLKRPVSWRKVPDAVLVDGPGREIRLVVEFGGAYAPARLRALHNHFARENVPYEIW